MDPDSTYGYHIVTAFDAFEMMDKYPVTQLFAQMSEPLYVGGKKGQSYNPHP